jgi:hypothetical protein
MVERLAGNLLLDFVVQIRLFGLLVGILWLDLLELCQQELKLQVVHHLQVGRMVVGTKVVVAVDTNEAGLVGNDLGS